MKSLNQWVNAVILGLINIIRTSCERSDSLSDTNGPLFNDRVRFLTSFDGVRRRSARDAYDYDYNNEDPSLFSRWNSRAGQSPGVAIEPVFRHPIPGLSSYPSPGNQGFNPNLKVQPNYPEYKPVQPNEIQTGFNNLFPVNHGYYLGNPPNLPPKDRNDLGRPGNERIPTEIPPAMTPRILDPSATRNPMDQPQYWTKCSDPRETFFIDQETSTKRNPEPFPNFQPENPSYTSTASPCLVPPPSCMVSLTIPIPYCIPAANSSPEPTNNWLTLYDPYAPTPVPLDISRQMYYKIKRPYEPRPCQPVVQEKQDCSSSPFYPQQSKCPNAKFEDLPPRKYECRTNHMGFNEPELSQETEEEDSEDDEVISSNRRFVPRVTPKDKPDDVLPGRVGLRQIFGGRRESNRARNNEKKGKFLHYPLGGRWIVNKQPMKLVSRHRDSEYHRRLPGNEREPHNSRQSELGSGVEPNVGSVDLKPVKRDKRRARRQSEFNITVIPEMSTAETLGMSEEKISRRLKVLQSALKDLQTSIEHQPLSDERFLPLTTKSPIIPADKVIHVRISFEVMNTSDATSKEAATDGSVENRITGYARPQATRTTDTGITERFKLAMNRSTISPPLADEFHRNEDDLDMSKPKSKRGVCGSRQEFLFFTDQPTNGEKSDLLLKQGRDVVSNMGESETFLTPDDQFGPDLKTDIEMMEELNAMERETGTLPTVRPVKRSAEESDTEDDDEPVADPDEVPLNVNDTEIIKEIKERKNVTSRPSTTQVTWSFVQDLGEIIDGAESECYCTVTTSKTGVPRHSTRPHHRHHKGHLCRHHNRNHTDKHLHRYHQQKIIAPVLANISSSLRSQLYRVAKAQKSFSQQKNKIAESFTFKPLREILMGMVHINSIQAESSTHEPDSGSD